MHKFLSCVRFGCWTRTPPPSLLRALLGSSFHIILMNTGPGWASKLFVMSHIIVFSSAHLEISHFTAKPKGFWNIIGCAVAESRFLFIQLEGQISGFYTHCLWRRATKNMQKWNHPYSWWKSARWHEWVQATLREVERNYLQFLLTL